MRHIVAVEAEDVACFSSWESLSRIQTFQVEVQGRQCLVVVEAASASPDLYVWIGSSEVHSCVVVEEDVVVVADVVGRLHFCSGYSGVQVAVQQGDAEEEACGGAC